jgi:Phosphotransferase enzyme family
MPGHIGRQPLLDIIFTSSSCSTAGPFPTVSSFHDFFVDPRSAHNHASGELPHPMRSELCDNAAIKFTHGDLHPSNIIVSTGGDGASPCIVAIVDWHQSGWFPEYWEYCKARWTAKIGDEWEVEYLPRFLEPSKQYDYWDYFVLSLGV